MENTERVKARWVDVVPTKHNGMEMFLIRDPEGLVGESLLVSRDVLFLISLMNGKRTVLDMQEAYMKAAGGVLLPVDRIVSVIEAMDAQFLLQNDRYEGQVRCAQGRVRGLVLPDVIFGGQELSRR